MIKRKHLLFILSAPSGAGKTSVYEKLLKEIDGLIPSISHTTRPPRSKEIHEKDYYFISRDEFKNKINANEFAEWNEYQGNYYGSSLENFSKVQTSGQDLLFDIDVNGASNIKKKFNNGIYIFILPPSINSLRERLIKRGADSREDIENRIKIAEKEMNQYIEYDYIVVNHKINETVRQISSIIFAERCRRSNLTLTKEDFVE